MHQGTYHQTPLPVWSVTRLSHLHADALSDLVQDGRLIRSTPIGQSILSYGTVTIADGAPVRVSGKMTTNEQPGLGVTPRLDVLGRPEFIIGTAQ